MAQGTYVVISSDTPRGDGFTVVRNDGHIVKWVINGKVQNYRVIDQQAAATMAAYLNADDSKYNQYLGSCRGDIRSSYIQSAIDSIEARIKLAIDDPTVLTFLNDILFDLSQAL